MGMLHQFGKLAGAGGEPDQRPLVGVRADRLRGIDLIERFARHGGAFFLVADPAWFGAFGQQHVLERGAIVVDLFKFGGIVDIGDDQLEFAGLHAVFDILRRQERRHGTLHNPQLDQGNGENPPLRNPGKHQSHRVVTFQPHFQQDIRRPVGKLTDVKKSQFAFGSVLVAPDHGKLVAILRGTLVDDIITEIKILRNLDSEIRIVSTCLSCHKFLS